MFSPEETTRLSRFLSLVLRHRPEELGLSLDGQGWTEVAPLLEALQARGWNVTRERLQWVVDTNAKKRFAFDESGLRIRASQGHSVEVDLGYTPETPPALLYHGTAERFVASIRQSGLRKGERHQVHLSADAATARQVGARHGKPVVFRVDAGRMHADGYPFYRSANGVWLTEEVPVRYLEGAVE
ncbi:MAG TPA: RNA 2'-phosphotransferase [Chitinophagaceae bacterium]|jgi:putative RNA 2'-phosphotransferase|nr:RNA 2'-phosphotransferase [Chitinophagaceae bacterium]